MPDGQQLAYEFNHQGLFTALDFNGHRLTQLERNALGQEVFHSQGNLFSGFDYDPAGRLHGIDDLRKGPTRYVYDQLDRLKAVGGGKLSTKYTYNSQNQLIKIEKDGQTFEYACDALGRRVRKQDSFGETEFLWNGDVLLSEKRNHAEKLYLYEPGSFKPLCFIERNQVYYYHLDHLGTPQEMTDWEGRIVWSARYRVYGNVLKQEVAEVENNLRFQGQYFDAETGLHYNRFRYYDPGTGQFVQQDPVGLLGGINNYQYAPNPAGWIDPLGLVCKEQILRNIEESQKARAASGFNNHINQQYPNPLERQLTKQQYKEMTSRTRGKDLELQNALDARIANQPYVYRYTTQDTVDKYYRPQGGIKRPAYTTADDLGLDSRVVMDKAQVFDHWGEPDVLVRVPTSAVTSAKVPRPFGNKHPVGWEPNTEAYPAAGSGGANQFLLTTDSWDDSWVIPLKTSKKGP